MRQCLVAGDVNFADFCFGFFIDVHQHFDVSVSVSVGLLQHLNIGVVESFFFEIFLYHCFCSVREVRSHLRAFADAHFDLHIFLLAFLQTIVFDFAYTRALLEAYLQPDFVAFNLGGGNLDVGEQSLLPESLDRFGYLVTGHLNLVTYSQTGETDKYEILV